MAFATFNGGQAVFPVGTQPETLFLVRQDTNEIDFYDISKAPPFMIWTAKFDLGDPHRGSRRRVRRIHVYGTGTVSAGSTITIATDMERGEVYACSPGNPNTQTLILQECASLVGNLITVTLFLQGTGIIIKNMELEYVPINS